MQINIPVEITERQMRDLIATGLEGGIGYWSHAQVIERGTPADELDYVITRIFVEDPTEDQIPEGAEVITLTHPYLGDYEMTEVGLLTIDTIKAGLTKAGELGGSYMRLIEDVANENEDADTADQIIQLGLFGEVVYG